MAIAAADSSGERHQRESPSSRSELVNLHQIQVRPSMDIAAYATEGHLRYAELAHTVAAILRAAIERSGHLRLQEIQRRAKDVDSLRKKIGKIAGAPQDVELAVKDLAGCRLIFYTNSDVTTFLNAGIIQDNFEIDWGRTKIHHPTKADPGADELFHSHNYVVRLKSPRIELPEHAHLGGLWCEVQVQTTLNHAWSEMAHDTIYKRPDLNGFGSSLMKSIDERMKNIMRDFLLPAGYEFQKVATDFERLSSGKELFDSNPLDALKACADNNERYDILSRFSDTVLPYYDEIEGIQDDIRKAMVEVVYAARSSAPQTIETPYETLAGRTSEAVARQALTVIDQLRYLGEDAARLTWRALAGIYPGASTEAEQKRILESVHHLAANDLRVWEVAGPVVQEVLTEELMSLDAEELSALRPVVLKALEAMQNLEAQATSLKGDTFTLSRGVVPYSAALASIRNQGFNILHTLLKVSATDAQRRDVIRCLRQASHVAFANAPEDTVVMVVKDATKITDLFIELAPTLSFELRQELEHDALWDYRRYVATDPDKPPCADREACNALAQSLLRFRTVLNSDEAYGVFKVLVGYNSVFEPAWTDPEFDIEAVDAYREERRREIIAGIDEQAASMWRKTLLRCAGTDASDGATLPPFHTFLKELGEAKPRMVLAFVRDNDPLWERFLPDMLKGVELGGLGADLEVLVDGWIDASVHLGAVLRYLEEAEPFSVDRLIRATRKAIDSDDDRGVLFAVSTISRRHRSAPDGLWPIFTDALRHLAANDDDRWLNFVWARTKQDGIFNGRSVAEAEVVLDVLRPLPRIDYQSESVLAAIAADSPRLVINFLADRVRQSRGESVRAFEALSRGFHLLHKILPREIGFLLAVARDLFREDEVSFRYRGVLLVNNVFPKYTDELDEALLEIVRDGSDTDVRFVVSLLGKYKANASTHDLCKEIVAKSENAEVRTDLRSAMTTFGVVGGEFGFSDAYQRVRDGIQPWLADERESVRSFAQEFSYQLDQTIASERRSAQLRQEQRKRS